jgi:hypothetical protein
LSEQAPNTSRLGRRLAAKRLQIALWIAVIEGVIILISQNISWWVAIIIAVPFILLYLLVGRTAQSDVGRQLAWIAGASQTFVVLLAILFSIIKVIMIILIAIFALVAFVFLYSDRPSRRASKS